MVPGGWCPACSRPAAHPGLGTGLSDHTGPPDTTRIGPSGHSSYAQGPGPRVDGPGCGQRVCFWTRSRGCSTRLAAGARTSRRDSSPGPQRSCGWSPSASPPRSSPSAHGNPQAALQGKCCLVPRATGGCHSLSLLGAQGTPRDPKGPLTDTPASTSVTKRPTARPLHNLMSSPVFRRGWSL